MGEWGQAQRREAKEKRYSALEGWSDCLRLEVAPFGVRVVIVEPGVIETGFGDVANANLLVRSAGGPYANLARSGAHSIADTYGKGTGSPGTVIADVVSKAVEAKKPKTRYAAGKYAKMLLGMRKWLSDRAFDGIILSQMKKA